MADGKLIAQNKKARHDYFIEETYEAGIALLGSEVKSIRNGKASIKEAYAEIKEGEVYVLGMNITPYAYGSTYAPDPVRPRKLLLHKREIGKLLGYTTREGYTLVPLKVYINGRGLIKVELAVAKGKKLYDKRHVLAKKDADRRIQQAMKQYGR